MATIPGMTEPQPLESFHCPYRKVCLTREAIRALVTILVAAVTAYAAGCTFKLHAPGLDMEGTVKYPTTQQGPVEVKIH